MEQLKQKILREGIVISDKILKVDSFLNHQIDPLLMHDIGTEFARRFADSRVTKVLTLESSGIAPALMTGLLLRVPVIFAKKRIPSTLTQGFYRTSVYSYTKQETTELIVAERFLSSADTILIIDDFLANGEAARGMTEIVTRSGASLAGIGIVIEKAFQPGGARLREKGLRVTSLVQIKRLTPGRIEFVEA
ncbi:MAG: xanthine phosphoribosyltransferase [bacterium]|jgi:xanthine phosphoribosyltransferase